MDEVGILLYKERGLIGSPIRWQTRGPYSHAALLRRGKVWESRFVTGVVCRDPDENDMRADLYVVHIDPEQDMDLGAWLARQEGKKYDLAMVIRFLTRGVEARRSSGKWFCSELVYAGLEKVGVPLLANTDPWEVSPNLLSRSPLLTPVRVTDN